MIRAAVCLALAMSLLLGCEEKNGVSKATVLPGITDNSGRQDFKVYSNPRSDNFVVAFDAAIAGKASVSIYDSDGKLLSRRDFAVNKGMNTWDYRFKFPASGMYIVKLVMNDLERDCRIYKTIS